MSEREIVYRKIRPEIVNTERGMLDEDESRKTKGDNYHDILGFSNKNEMYKWIEGKKVLDIGSGHGLFAMDVMKERGKDFAYVVSVNPALKNADFRDEQEEQALYSYTRLKREGGKLKAEQVWDLLSEVRKRTVATSWDSKYVANSVDKNGEDVERYLWSELPFADESFDRIISSFSFPYYARGYKIQTLKRREKRGFLDKKIEPEVVDKEYGHDTSTILADEAKEEIVRALKSIIRILKPGGECRLSPLDSHMDVSGQGILNIMMEKGLLKKLGAEIKMVPAVKDKHSYCVIKKPLKKVE